MVVDGWFWLFCWVGLIFLMFIYLVVFIRFGMIFV